MNPTESVGTGDVGKREEGKKERKNWFLSLWIFPKPCEKKQLYILHTWRRLPAGELHTDGWEGCGNLGLITLLSLSFSKGTSITGPILMDFFKWEQLI